MMLPELIYSNTQRFSLASCATQDSVDSIAIATPLDASPPPPPSNTFTIINIVNDDPLPTLSNYPEIASTYIARRRRAQTSPTPVPSSIIQSIPQQPIMVHSMNSEIKPNTNTNANQKIKKFWPRIKRMMMPSNATEDSSQDQKVIELLQSLHLSNQQDKLEPNKPLPSRKNKRWLGRNSSRVGPQR